MVNGKCFLFVNGKKQGPYTREEILALHHSGALNAENMLREDGNPWIMLRDVPWIPFAFENTTEPDAENENSTDAASTPEDGRILECPHCWAKFKISKINFISKHIELMGDPILGQDAQMRFLPTSFNEQGYAIDARGMVCQEMACPHCHLKIPDACVDVPSSLFSIVGAPASGKSYYLTAMTWQLRNILSRKFDYTLTDTDATFNSVLNNYEQILFLNRQEDEFVALPKTELQGNDFSNQILLNGMSVDLPLPFIFTLTPMPSNQNVSTVGIRNIIFYDNAGEHFEPGRDQVTNLATRHLIHSDSIVFLYDPIKDSRMIKHCSPDDPQVAQISRGANQLVLLNEMIARIRKYGGLKIQEKYARPLIVVIPKYDAWRDAFPIELADADFTYYNKSRMSYYLDIGMVSLVSFMMREKLLEISPEVVAACESFFSTVYFIPVSALGRMPELDQKKGMIAIKPQDLKPIWAEVPTLLQFCYAGLIRAADGLSVEAVPVEKYKFIDGSLVYTLPGQNERESVPSTYWGRTVYCTKLKKYIKFPEKTESVSPAAADVASDDFWQN